MKPLRHIRRLPLLRSKRTKSFYFGAFCFVLGEFGGRTAGWTGISFCSFFFFFFNVFQSKVVRHIAYTDCLEPLGQHVDCVLMWQRKQHDNSATTQLLFLSPSTGRFLLYIAERSLAILRLSVFLCPRPPPFLFYFEMRLSCWGKSIEDVWRTLTVGAEFPRVFQLAVGGAVDLRDAELEHPRAVNVCMLWREGEKLLPYHPGIQGTKVTLAHQTPFFPYDGSSFWRQGGCKLSAATPESLALSQTLTSRHFSGAPLFLRWTSARSVISNPGSISTVPFFFFFFFFLRVASWHKRTAPFGCFCFVLFFNLI